MSEWTGGHKFNYTTGEVRQFLNQASVGVVFQATNIVLYEYDDGGIEAGAMIRCTEKLIKHIQTTRGVW